MPTVRKGLTILYAFEKMVKIVDWLGSYTFMYTSNILDVGMEKEQKQELGWKISVLPIPAFHCI